MEFIIEPGESGIHLTSLDIRLVGKGYLDRSGRNELRFKNNMSGPDFIASFLKRNSGEKHLKGYKNLKSSRAVNADKVNSYFDELRDKMKNVEF